MNKILAISFASLAAMAVSPAFAGTTVERPAAEHKAEGAPAPHEGAKPLKEILPAAKADFPQIDLANVKSFADLQAQFDEALKQVIAQKKDPIEWASSLATACSKAITDMVQAGLTAETKVEDKIKLLDVIHLLPAEALKAGDPKTVAVQGALKSVLESARTVDEYKKLTESLIGATGFNRAATDGKLVVPSVRELETVVGSAVSDSADHLLTLVPSLAELRGIESFKSDFPRGKRYGVGAFVMYIAALLPADAKESDFFVVLADIATERKIPRAMRMKIAEKLRDYWKARITQGGAELDVSVLEKNSDFRKVLKWAGQELVKGTSDKWSVQERQTWGQWVTGLYDRILKALRIRKKEPAVGASVPGQFQDGEGI